MEALWFAGRPAPCCFVGGYVLFDHHIETTTREDPKSWKERASPRKAIWADF